MNRSLLIILLLIPEASCGASKGQRASLKYDVNGRRTLHAYDLKPAKSLGQAEIIAQRLYGTRNLQRPDEAYFCTWRDTGPDQYINRFNRAGRPSKIFLACRFGASRWSPPANLIEAATEHAKRESAVIRIEWDRLPDRYVLRRFEIELNHRPALSFRSQNLTKGELPALGVRIHKMTIPSSPQDGFSFHLTARVPSRQNSGMKAVGPIIPVEIDGSAMPMPMPNWLLY
ncbi:hypothetical protein [Sphingomonas mollis]|uniref:Uncharacterized protein n=1 Tax=Sphingomonas mollis TaxID=2795726 RepID=A0ABS0XM42_9SPHN|nr:hypothetical protein [Sphingomonas sp. BT553]MBJ6120798.1 hypothetical protein [Sphingomonas sp. BT553]